MNTDLSQVVGVKLLSAEKNGNIISVHREMTFVDGTILNGKHSFPEDTMEWRAAEYGINPADLDTLIDIVIHEPFMGEPDRPDLLLYDAPTIDDARVYHISRVDTIKAKMQQPKTAAIDQVREQIRRFAIINQEAIIIKQESVRRDRDSYQNAKNEQAKARLNALFVDPRALENARLAHLRSKLAKSRPTTI